MRRTWRILRVASALWACGALASGVSAVVTQPCSALTDGPDLDVAVVLGGGLVDGFARDANSGARVEAAAVLYRSGRVARMVLTGGQISRNWSIAEAMAIHARDLGIPSEAVILEADAQSTLENALFTARLLRDDADIVLVTSGFHAVRGRAALAWAGIPADAACRSARFDEPGVIGIGQTLALEGVKWTVNILRAAVWSGAEKLTRHNPLPRWWLE